MTNQTFYDATGISPLETRIARLAGAVTRERISSKRVAVVPANKELRAWLDKTTPGWTTVLLDAKRHLVFQTPQHLAHYRLRWG